MSAKSLRVVYVATGANHIREAAASIKSLWHHNPSIAVTMFVDQASRLTRERIHIPTPPSEHQLEIVDHPQPTYSWTDKPIALSQLQNERVLFLDTDTRICGDIAEIFDLLEVFDLAVAHAPIRLDPRQPGSLAQRVPATFPELNTGVIALRSTIAVGRFLQEWRRIHLEFVESTHQGLIGDQAAFRIALFESSLRFCVLTPEYNCRFVFPVYVHGPVTILHGRWPDLPRIESALNGVRGPRVFVPGRGVIQVSPVLLRLKRRYHSWRSQGTVTILRKRIPRRRPRGV